jgi:hypothetical protein
MEILSTISMQTELQSSSYSQQGGKVLEKNKMEIVSKISMQTDLQISKL